MARPWRDTDIVDDPGYSRESAADDPRHRRRLEQLGDTDEDYVALEVTWSVYQQIITAYQHPTRSEGKKLMHKVISTLRSLTMPKGSNEIK